MTFTTLESMLAHAHMEGAVGEAQYLMTYGQSCMGQPTQPVFYFDESNQDGYSIALFPLTPITSIMLDPRTRPNLIGWVEETTVMTPKAILIAFRHRIGGPRLQLLMYMSQEGPATPRQARRPPLTAWQRLLTPEDE